MSGVHAWAVARTMIAAFGLAVVALSISLVDGPRTSGAATRGTTYGDFSTSFAMLEVLVGVALLAAALLLLAERSTATLGALAVAASAAWFAPVWVGWEGGAELVRSVGLVVSPLLSAAVLAIAALVPPATTGGRRLVLVGLVALTTAFGAASSIALALVREPIRDLYCWSNCTANVFLVRDDVELARRLTWVVLGFGAACGLLAALVGVVRLARASAVTRRASGLSFAAAALVGLALAAYSLALALAPREAPDRPLYEALFVARAVALVGLAGALGWLAVRPRLVRGLVTRLAVDLERSAAEGGLGRMLARALGDPGLRIGYPIGPGERIVDADGRQVAVQPARRLTPVVGDEGVVALIESDVTLVALERELGPAAHLALGNERLRAEALARLAEVTSSRARIVDAMDGARRRMERDLHDGAQQRMLALTYDLRVALTIAESSGNVNAVAPLRLALQRAVAASHELRDGAHGIFPAALTASGLEAALDSLADVRPLRLTIDLPPGRRYAPKIETAAYAALAEGLDAANGTVAATVAERDGRLRLDVDGIDTWGDRLVYVEDRIRAAGGDVSVDRGRLEIELPCQ